MFWSKYNVPWFVCDGWGPLPTHSRQISVATTLIRVGWATNLQKMKSWKAMGWSPKKLSLVQGVWRDPFKRSCFKNSWKFEKKYVGGKKAFVCICLGQGKYLVPACHPNRKEIQEVGYFKMFFLRIWYVVIVFPSELRCLASAAALASTSIFALLAVSRNLWTTQQHPSTHLSPKNGEQVQHFSAPEKTCRACGVCLFCGVVRVELFVWRIRQCGR